MNEKYEDLKQRLIEEEKTVQDYEESQVSKKLSIAPADLFDQKQETKEQTLFDKTEEKEIKIANLDLIQKQEEQGAILSHSVITMVEEHSHETERRLIGESHQLHELSTVGRLKRDLKTNTKKQVETEKHNLEVVVKNIMTEEEAKQLAKDTKTFLERFWSLKEALAKDPVLNTDEKARMLYNFAKPYAADMKKFKEIYVNDLIKSKRQDNIYMYLERFDGLMEFFDKLDSGNDANGALITVLGFRISSAHYEMFQGDLNMLDKAKKRAKDKDTVVAKKIMQDKIKTGQKGKAPKPVSEAESVKLRNDLDSTLSKEQMEGVRAADAWLIEKGIKSNKRLPFINTLMELSARERLFMYRIIEEGHLEAPKLNDVAISQTEYIPDVSKISRVMYRVPFRLWEKLSNEGMVQHHWEKLESALQIVKNPSVAQMIKGFSDATKHEDETDTKENDNIFEERNKLIEEAIKACKEYEAAQNKADSAWVYKESKAEIAKEKQKTAIAALKALKDVDEKIESKYTEGSDLKEYSMYASGQALGLMAKLGSVTKLMQPMITESLKAAKMAGDAGKIGQIQQGLDGANITAGALVTAKGVHTLISSLGAIKKTYNAISTGDIALSDSILMGAQAGYGFAAGLTTATIGLVNIKYAKMTTDLMMGATDVKDAIDVMKSNVQKANVALAVGSLALNTGDAMVQLKNRHHYDKAETVMDYMKTTGELKGDDEKFLENTKKLQKRNMDRKAVGTTFSAVTNMGTLAATFAGPAGTLAWGGISLGLSVATKLTDYLLADKSKKKTAEEFFDLLDIEDLIQTDKEEDENRTAYRKRAIRDLKESPTKQKRLKESLLLHMSATLGFTTFKSLFKHIIQQYGMFLHRCLFYHEGRIITEKQKDDYPMSVAAAELLMSMGLDVKYPPVDNEAYAEQYWHPSLKMIIGKLGA